MKAAVSIYAVIILFLLPVLYWGCSRHPYTATNKVYRQQVKAFAAQLRAEPPADSMPPAYWVGTTNFGLRKPNYVIIHHTAQNSCEQTLKTFTLARTQVSSHYVICRNGTVHHMLNDYLRAWHAGNSQWGGNTDINSSSIGIEIDNNGSEPFSDAQINSLLRLLGRLKKDYAIPASHFIGHSDIAPGRKVDPSRYFPWQQLAVNGYGMWYGDTTAIQVPETFKPLQTLKLIGYNTKDSISAVSAFKLHFVPNDSTRMLTDGDKKIMISLLEQKP